MAARELHQSVTRAGALAIPVRVGEVTQAHFSTWAVHDRLRVDRMATRVTRGRC